MKKISLNLIKESLTRDEMRSITGGSGSSNGPCSVYFQGMGWCSGYTVADAQWFYQTDPEATGYCCASC